MTQESEPKNSLPPEESTAAPAAEVPSSAEPETPATQEDTAAEPATSAAETAAEPASTSEVSQDAEAPEAGEESLTEHIEVPAEEPAAQTPATNPDGTPAAETPPSAALLTADSMPLVQVVEALLFSTDMPLSAAKLAETCGLDSQKPIKDAVAELNSAYEQRQAAYRIEDRAGGYQILTLPQYADYITRLVRKKDEGRLTPAMLETLAIIAYKQPIIRADIEAIRGVGAGEVLRSLMEHNLVKIVGRAEEIGRPMLYGTTRYFLEVFGLASLKDLPKAEQLKEPK